MMRGASERARSELSRSEGADRGREACLVPEEAGGSGPGAEVLDNPGPAYEIGWTTGDLVMMPGTP